MLSGAIGAGRHDAVLMTSPCAIIGLHAHHDELVVQPPQSGRPRPQPGTSRPRPRCCWGDFDPASHARPLPVRSGTGLPEELAGLPGAQAPHVDKAVIEEKDMYRAQRPPSLGGSPVIAAGAEGHKARPGGQDHGIPALTRSGAGARPPGGA